MITRQDYIHQETNDDWTEVQDKILDIAAESTTIQPFAS